MNDTGCKKTFISTTLVHTLLYPAVLGAMFYNFLPTLFSPAEIINEKLLFLSTILLIVYFCVDYAYIVCFPSYSLLSGLLDTLALVFMYRVETLLNPLGSIQFTSAPATLLMIIHLLFIVWDVKERAWEMLYLNIPATVLLAICAFLFPYLPFFIFIQIAMISTFSFILWRRLHTANR
jgi:hypothetical protein